MCLCAASVGGVHPAAAQLACHLIREAFGDLCEAVLRCLLHRGPATFPELRQTLSDVIFYQKYKGICDSNLTGAKPLGPVDTRRALLVLLQHGCVTVRIPVSETSRPEHAVYRVDVSAILYRLRYPRCIRHIQQHFDCLVKATIMEQLFNNGQLTLEQVRDAATTALGKAGYECDKEKVLLSIAILVDAHYIERSPPCTLPAVKVAVHPNALPRRGRAAPKPGTPEEKRANQERSKAITVKRYHNTRYDLATQELHGHEGTDGAIDVKPKIPQPSAQAIPAVRATSTTGKRKREPDEDIAELMACSLEHNGLWRASQTEFSRQLRYEACAEFMAEKHGEEAGIVVLGMLVGSTVSHSDDQGLESTSATMTQTSIVAATQRLPDGKQMDGAAIRKTLQSLRNAVDGSVLTTPEGSFYVHLDRTVELMQEAAVQAHLLSRFGHEGLRIWSMLRLRGQLEEASIAESALMAPKEARTMLYTLLSSGFVSLQDLPKGSDRAASRMFWTWRAHLPSAIDLLRAHVMKGILNLHLRLEHEAKELEHETRLYEAQGDLTNSQMAALHHLRDIQKVCGGRLLRLQPLLTLLNEF